MGSIEDLKAVVGMTGATGEWQEKGRGQWQFRCNDGAILNWWQTTGTISYQGPQTERQEFEQIVDLAIDNASANKPQQPPPLQPLPSVPSLPPLPLGRYRHHKGNEYEVIGIARHSETLEELVVYRALYGDRGLWVRPRAMFAEMVRVGGRTVPRFRL